MFLKIISTRFINWYTKFKKKIFLFFFFFSRPSVPPAYNVAAQRALLHRLGRAHSHEGVTSSISISSAPLGFYQPNTEDTGTKSLIKCHHLLILRMHLIIPNHFYR